MWKIGSFTKKLALIFGIFICLLIVVGLVARFNKPEASDATIKTEVANFLKNYKAGALAGKDIYFSEYFEVANFDIKDKWYHDNMMEAICHVTFHEKKNLIPFSTC